MQYLTVEETVRRLRAAGVSAAPRMVRNWVRQRRVQDVWVLGSRTYIYEGELDALIANARSR